MASCAKGGSAIAASIGRLWQACFGKLMRDALARAASREVAEDVVVAAFAKAWKQCGGYRGEGTPQAWLQTMVRRAIIDHWRTLRPELPLTDDDGEAIAEVEAALVAAGRDRHFDPVAQIEDAQARRVYERCFRRFAADHPQAAAVIAWVAEDGWDVAELSRVLNRSPAATREYLSQCRKKARIYFAEWYALVKPVRHMASVSDDE